MDVTIALQIGGAHRAVTVDTRTSLLDALRERLADTSPKKGCNYGQRDACTVLADGARTLSRLTPAGNLRLDLARPGLVVNVTGITSDRTEKRTQRRARLLHAARRTRVRTNIGTHCLAPAIPRKEIAR